MPVSKQQLDIIIEDEIYESELFEFELPRLTKRNANLPRLELENESVLKQDEYIADYSIINRYTSFPYIIYSNYVINGYIAYNNIPSDIQSLCAQYVYSEQDGIFQLAFFVSRILNKLISKKISFASGINGIELIQQMIKYIKGFKLLRDEEIVYFCNELIQSKFIRPITTKYLSFGGVVDSLFCASTKYLYEFNPIKAKLFREYIKFNSIYDRMAWNIGTLVEINSQSTNGWKLGQIVEIDNDKKKITVVFNTFYGDLLRKTINRFNANKVRSTSQFINNRRKWSKNTEIEVYSHSMHQWYKGKISDVIIRNEDKSYMDEIKVVYNNNNKLCCKLIPRWSHDIRDILENNISSNNSFKSGKKVLIFSKSQKRWIAGHIKVIIPIVQCVIVRYGKSEKIVEMKSDQIKDV